MFRFQFLGPRDAHRVKIQVDLGLEQVSRSCSTSRVLKITYFCHYVPWTKIPDDMKRFLDYQNQVRKYILYVLIIWLLKKKLNYFLFFRLRRSTPSWRPLTSPLSLSGPAFSPSASSPSTSRTSLPTLDPVPEPPQLPLLVVLPLQPPLPPKRWDIYSISVKQNSY